MTLTLRFEDTPPSGPIILPGSKSIAARALILRYVFGNCTRLSGMPDCDDTRELQEAMFKLSANRHRFAHYHLGTGGTSLRFFTALAASLPGLEAEIDCSDALRRRPLSPLVDALRTAGADITYLKEEGHAPLLIKGKQLDGNGVEVDSSMSSQFASALMMVSSLWKSPFKVSKESYVSRPYIEMTERMIEQFALRPEEYHIEGDWSAASFFYEYALLRPGVEVTIDNMPPLTGSLQGDSACLDIFARLGVTTIPLSPTSARLVGRNVLRPYMPRLVGRGMPRPYTSQQLNNSTTQQLNLADEPDLVPPLAVGMAMAGIPFRISGIGHLRHKESDRIATLTAELAKASLPLISTPSTLSFTPTTSFAAGGEFDSHGDHRIAMALAIATVKTGELTLAGAEAVTKSFPSFFSQLPHLSIQPIP